MSDGLLTAVTIGVVAVMTWITRALPYVLFGGKKEPHPTVKYLGDVLPAAIMIILVIYCLRNTDFVNYPHGLAELISVVLTMAMQFLRKNTVLSIVVGTVCYMLLIRTVFPI